MSWLEIYRVEAERRNAETRRTVRAARAEAYAAREKIRKAKYQREHRELCKECSRRFRSKNPGYFKAWREAHPGYAKAWYAAHPGKNAEYQRRARAKRRERLQSTNQERERQ